MRSRHSHGWRLSLLINILLQGEVSRSVPPAVLGISGMGTSAVESKSKQFQDLLKNLGASRLPLARCARGGA
jgi:hypothetical protein